MSETLVRYTRTGPGEPSTDAGLEVGSDGVVTSRQSGAHRIGRFARTLTADERATLDAALDEAREAAPAVAAPSGVHTTVEQVTADGLSLSLEHGSDPPAGTAPLVDLLRALLVDLAEHPVAGLELVVTDTPRHTFLRHVGDTDLRVRIAALTVQVSVLDADSAVVGGDTTNLDVGVDGTVGPGWSVDLPVDVAATPDGGFVSVTAGPVEVDLTGENVLWADQLGWSDGWEDA